MPTCNCCCYSTEEQIALQRTMCPEKEAAQLFRLCCLRKFSIPSLLAREPSLQCTFAAEVCNESQRERQVTSVQRVDSVGKAGHQLKMTQQFKSYKYFEIFYRSVCIRFRRKLCGTASWQRIG